MTHDVAGGPGSAGRHRSPWGRSGRILPIRWGRIAAAAAALAVLAASLVILRLRLEENGHAGRPGAQSSQRGPLGSAPPDVLAATPTSGRVGGSTPFSTALPGPADVVPTDPVVASPTAGAGTGTVGGGGVGATRRGVAPRPSGPVLGLSTTSVNLGKVDSVWRVNLRGDGTAPVDVVVGGTPAWLSVVPNQRQVSPGAQVPLMITLDRAKAPAGPVDVTVPVQARGGSGGGDLRITASVDDSPRIMSVTAAPAQIVRAGCPTTAGANAGAPTRNSQPAGGQPVGGQPAAAGAAQGGDTAAGNPPPTPATAAAGASAAAASTTTITLTADDAVGIFTVELAAALPGGKNQTLAMDLGTASGTRSTWTGQLTAPTQTGTLTYTASVTDLNGKRAQLPGQLSVLPCPR